MSTINLLPEDYLDRRAQQRANILCLLLFGVVMAGIITAAVITEDRANGARLIREKVNGEYKNASKLINELQQLEAKKKQLIAKARDAAELQERLPRSTLLAAIVNAMPKDTGLSQVIITTRQDKATQTARPTKFISRSAARAGTTPVGADARPDPLKVTIEVVGLAKDNLQVAQFLEAMKNNDLMQSVDMLYSDEKKVGESIVREFRVQMVLRPDAEVDLTPANQNEPDEARQVTARTTDRGPQS